MKTTAREVRARNRVIIEVGYCDLYHTLHECADRRDAHTEGVYGWNADIYEFNSFAIVTGYRPFGNEMLDYDFKKKWEKLAQKHYDKCYEKLPSGKYRTGAQIARMRLTFRAKFTSAVLAQLEKQHAKGKKRKAA